MTGKQTIKELKTAEVHPAFAPVVEAFAQDRRVSHGDGKGFGSGALKVDGRIFAMMSSKGKLVVKLPKTRVDELVASGQGERFDPGHGRLMKQWIALEARSASWIEFAQEACHFTASNLAK